MQIVYALYLLLLGVIAAHTLAVVGSSLAFIAGLLTLIFAQHIVAWAEIHFPELHSTPGFRTKTPWRMAVAVTVIILALTHISSYLVRIEAKTLQYQTGKTQIFLTIHENKDNPSGNENNQGNSRQVKNQNSQVSLSTKPANLPPATTNKLVLTPDVQIIINWIIETFNRITD